MIILNTFINLLILKLKALILEILRLNVSKAVSGKDLIDMISKYIDTLAIIDEEPENGGKLATKKLITQYKLEKYIKANYQLRNNTIKNRYEYFQGGTWQMLRTCFITL